MFEPENKDDKLQKRFKLLQENENWQQIRKAWRKLAIVKNIPNPEQVIFMLSGILQPQSINFDEELLIKLDKLQEEQLLKKNEVTFLNNIFQARLDHIMRSCMAVTCYMMTPEGLQEVETKDKLEERILKLESLFKADKINQQTFEETKSNIMNSLKALAQIEDEEISFELPIKPEYVELIVELSK